MIHLIVDSQSFQATFARLKYARFRRMERKCSPATVGVGFSAPAMFLVERQCISAGKLGNTLLLAPRIAIQKISPVAAYDNDLAIFF